MLKLIASNLCKADFEPIITLQEPILYADLAQTRMLSFQNGKVRDWVDV